MHAILALRDLIQDHQVIVVVINAVLVPIYGVKLWMALFASPGRNRASSSADSRVIVPLRAGTGSAPSMNSRSIWPALADTRRLKAPSGGPDLGRVTDFLLLMAASPSEALGGRRC